MAVACSCCWSLSLLLYVLLAGRASCVFSIVTGIVIAADGAPGAGAGKTSIITRVVLQSTDGTCPVSSGAVALPTLALCREPIALLLVVVRGRGRGGPMRSGASLTHLRSALILESALAAGPSSASFRVIQWSLAL